MPRFCAQTLGIKSKSLCLRALRKEVGGEGKAFNSSQLSTLVAYQKQRWVKGGTFDYGAQGRDHRARCICNFVLGKQLARLASGNGAGCERAGLGHMTPRRQVSVV